ncbi:MAG TPA: DsbA family protein, partial [Acidimicrobiia bacterium]
MARSIAVTFDYRCPFAYNGNAAVIASLRAGSDVDFRFVPFSLDQVHVAEGEPAMWEREPAEWGTGVLSLLYGIAVRDTFPDQFFDAHLALFAARHDHGRQLQDEAVVRDAIASVGLDADAVAEEAHSGRPLKALAAEHSEAVDVWSVFGVPTYIEDEQAVFVRFMERGRADDLE